MEIKIRFKKKKKTKDPEERCDGACLESQLLKRIRRRSFGAQEFEANLGNMRTRLKITKGN